MTSVGYAYKYNVVSEKCAVFIIAQFSRKIRVIGYKILKKFFFALNSFKLLPIGVFALIGYPP